MKSVPIPILIGLVILAFPSATFSAETPCVLDQLIVPLQQKADAITRTITNLERQLQSLARSAFKSNADRATNQQKKQEAQNKINVQKGELDKINKDLALLKQKRAVFPKMKAAARCDIYCAATVDAEALGTEADRVNEAFAQAFPTTAVSFEARPQVFVYANANDLAANETSAMAAVGYSRKQSCAMGLTGAPPAPLNPKQTLLALHAAEGNNAFRHMVAHAYLEEIAGPPVVGGGSKRSAFIREGFAENIAAAGDEKVYETRARYLVKNALVLPSFGDASLVTLVTTEDPPTDNQNKALNLYGEATVFVRWASALTNGYQLLRQLVCARPDEIESIIRNHQSGRGAERTGFEEYVNWRTIELGRIREAEAKAPEAAPPAPTAPTAPVAPAAPATNAAPVAPVAPVAPATTNAPPAAAAAPNP